MFVFYLIIVFTLAICGYYCIVNTIEMDIAIIYNYNIDIEYIEPLFLRLYNNAFHIIEFLQSNNNAVNTGSYNNSSALYLLVTDDVMAETNGSEFRSNFVWVGMFSRHFAVSQVPSS